MVWRPVEGWVPDCVSSREQGRWLTPGIGKVTAAEAELMLISEDTCKRPTRGGASGGARPSRSSNWTEALGDVASLIS